jgi:UDPglucose 6-dehydrogenase
MASGKVAGVDFGLAVNPEFARQTSAAQGVDRPWITVIGACDDLAAQTLKSLYEPFGEACVMCTPTEAEMITYTSNLCDSGKISYLNEVHAQCAAVGAGGGVVPSAVSRSAESMWNPVYGTRGDGPYGGVCLPTDTHAFLGFAHDHGLERPVLAAAIAVNNRLRRHVAPAESPYKPEGALFVARAQRAALSGSASKGGCGEVWNAAVAPVRRERGGRQNALEKGEKWIYYQHSSDQ